MQSAANVVDGVGTGQRQLFWPLLLPEPIMLPKFLQLLIDAHGSDVPLVSLYLFTPFARSTHQLPRHNPTPLLHSPLQRTETAPAEALRMTAYQPTEQFRGCGIRLMLKPAQYLAPHSTSVKSLLRTITNIQGRGNDGPPRFP